MSAATLLLPARKRLAGQRLSPAVAKALGRAERGSTEAGERAQLLRHFQLLPRHWPVAALTRQLDAGDAAGSAWVRADPACVVPDMQGARLMGYGSSLDVDEHDIAALLPALKPLFGDAGLLLDAPEPSRWYLRAAPGLELPEFVEPGEVLGADLFDHLPQGVPGRRWRALLTEAQVLLHQHPWNQQRAARGKPAINSLWFWGGGELPHAVTSQHAQVRSREPLLRALALASGADGDGTPAVDALVDLRHLRSLEQVDGEAITPLLAALARGELQRLVLDFQDGAHFVIERRQRWRFWRRPLAGVDA
ncbi:phosphoglycerate mutase [Stenotrophomonas sp. MMGLT7]|uniref:phosphoglycerate mutase n=1 Tax=Stenotrophomonas sp. MMGLT7 TaxID=2901227 RepID=UPI001E373F15|nr:phosphoglycerate mutase [Stenotrophomonas sp. MMGLT7]MCD7097121.1 phosphoglycerate mutase [Stenotrophomonas sp. MMGLT7]